MKKQYSQPELELRKYRLNFDSVTTSDPAENTGNGLEKDDQNDYFGN